MIKKGFLVESLEVNKEQHCFNERKKSRRLDKTHIDSGGVSSCPESSPVLQLADSSDFLEEVNWPFLRCILADIQIKDGNRKEW